MQSNTLIFIELERKMLIRFHWANLAALIPMPCAEYQRFSGVDQ